MSNMLLKFLQFLRRKRRKRQKQQQQQQQQQQQLKQQQWNQQQQHDQRNVRQISKYQVEQEYCQQYQQQQQQLHQHYHHQQSNEQYRKNEPVRLEQRQIYAPVSNENIATCDEVNDFTKDLDFAGQRLRGDRNETNVSLSSSSSRSSSSSIVTRNVRFDDRFYCANDFRYVTPSSTHSLSQSSITFPSRETTVNNARTTTFVENNNDRCLGKSFFSASGAVSSPSSLMSVSDDSRKCRLINYLRQRKLLFTRYEDYSNLMSLMEKRMFHDYDERLFVDLLRRYVLLSQRVRRCPDSNRTRNECDLAYREMISLIKC